MGLEETKVEVEVGGTTRSSSTLTWFEAWCGSDMRLGVSGALLSLPSAVFAGKLPLWLVFHGTDGQATDPLPATVSCWERFPTRR